MSGVVTVPGVDNATECGVSATAEVYMRTIAVPAVIDEVVVESEEGDDAVLKVTFTHTEDDGGCPVEFYYFEIYENDEALNMVG